MLLTRRGNVLYVHLHKDPIKEAVQLKPITVAPRRATLLNTGKPVEFAVEHRHWPEVPVAQPCGELFGHDDRAVIPTGAPDGDGQSRLSLGAGFQ